MLSTTTWAEIQTRLSYFLSDTYNEENEDTPWLHAPEFRVIAWNWAQRVLAIAHTPRLQSTVLTTDADGRSAILPNDFLDVWRIYDEDEQMWLKRMPIPLEGATRYPDDELGQYWIWGGYLYLEKTLGLTDSQLTLYYMAYYPELEYELDTSEEEGLVVTQDQILIPPWAVLPCTHLATAQLLAPGSIEAARNRNYNLRIDSGTPSDNARALQAREHLFWWNTLVGMVSPGMWGRRV